MYCPNCAAQIDGVKFCRSCGANVSLVPDALSGHLEPPADEGGRRSRRRRVKSGPSIEKAVSSIFTGLGFLFVSFAVLRFFPAGRIWWFWMLIPAFACLGEGIGQYLRLRSEQRRSALPGHNAPNAMSSLPQPVPQQQIKAPTTSELVAPPGSVAEGTTRHLDPARKANN
jgi:hypothetical protein